MVHWGDFANHIILYNETFCVVCACAIYVPYGYNYWDSAKSLQGQAEIGGILNVR